MLFSHCYSISYPVWIILISFSEYGEALNLPLSFSGLFDQLSLFLSYTLGELLPSVSLALPFETLYHVLFQIYVPISFIAITNDSNQLALYDAGIPCRSRYPFAVLVIF